MMTKFLRQLKRRRVLHTASLYVVGAWIALQVVEVLSGAGLPPSTMRNLLVALSIGFPAALVIGWFFDISKDGVIKTGPMKEGEQLPELNFTDHLLLVGLVLVVTVDAYILSFPPLEENQVVTRSASQQRTLAVLSFEDIELAEGSDPVGQVFAGELRSSLTRIAGLRVLGPETSKALDLAGDGRLAMARELLVTALLLGEVLLDGDRIQITARLLGVPAGNPLWSNSVEGPVDEAIALQQGLLEQIVGAVAPTLDFDPVQGPRAEAGECGTAYDTYLRGKQLSKARHKTQAEQYERGMELLHEVVAIDERCALAWEAIAAGSVDWTMPGFVKASAAARRALELNDSLPEAWTVLAEIAEEEERWGDSEEFFLRALYSDPTNARANVMYSEALVARGRAQDALHYALEAYRNEPASPGINGRVAMAAHYAGESDLMIKHVGIAGEIAGEIEPYLLDTLAEAYLQKGDTERALEAYAGMGERIASWFPDCVRVRDDPELAPGVHAELRKTLEQYKSGELNPAQTWYWGWNIIRCSIWLGDPDLTFELLFADDVGPVEGSTPTEVIFINMFHPDGSILRQDPRFHELVVESGLLDYWQEWGWSDYCEPYGDSFRCDE